MLAPLIACLCVMLASLIGKLFTWQHAGSLIERNLHFLVSFAAGVFLVIAYQLTGEIVENTGSLVLGLPWIAIGSLVVFVLVRYIPNFHHHHDVNATDHTHSQIDARRILISDAIHNIGDGAVIVASFAASFLLGLTSTISILVHEILQEISEFFVLRDAGLSVRKALIYNFLTSSTILIGAIGAYFLLEQFKALKAPLLGLAAGSYLVVVFNDLIPHAFTSAEWPRHHIKHLTFFVAGLLFMTLLIMVLPHTE